MAFPTETVYGLGADACNALAVARVFELKRRPFFDPLIVHISDPNTAKRYGVLSHPLAEKLIRHFWPGPLTLVVPKKEVVPPIVTAGLDTVAIRMPSHPAAQSFIGACGCAIAAPSANPFGYVSPTEARHVAEGLPGVDLILDGGRCPVGVESTIIFLAGSKPRVLRLGGLSIEDLEAVIGPIDRRLQEKEQPESPGQLSRHYATLTPLEIADESHEIADPRERIGLLSLLPPEDSRHYAAVAVLSKSGDLREAATNLFAALRKLDSLKLDRLVARPVPEQGLGAAIMDRLRRCQAQKGPNGETEE